MSTIETGWRLVEIVRSSTFPVPIALDLSARAGWEQLIEIVDENGDPIDVSGYTWTAAVYAKAQDTDALQDITVDDTNAAIGELTISLTQAEVAGLVDTGKKSRSAWWSMIRTPAGGEPEEYYAGPVTAGYGFTTNDEDDG